MPSLSVQTAAPPEQSNQEEETTNRSVHFATEDETLDDDVEDSHYFECDDDDESDDEILDIVADAQYLALNQGQAPRWKDVESAHEELVVHVDYARAKAFSLCKEETKFVKQRVERRLNGASSKSFKNLLDIFFGPRSYLWKGIQNALDNNNFRNPDAPILMQHEEFMKHLSTFFIAASYHEVSTHHKKVESLLIIFDDLTLSSLYICL